MLKTFRNKTSRKKMLYARELRKRATTPERILWECLRRKALGVKFRRQSVILGYIADFYCPSKRLIIELDGKVHEERKEQDATRDCHLISAGFRVVRFPNSDIYEHLGLVIDAIKSEIG